MYVIWLEQNTIREYKIFTVLRGIHINNERPDIIIFTKKDMINIDMQRQVDMKRYLRYKYDIGIITKQPSNVQELF